MKTLHYPVLAGLLMAVTGSVPASSVPASFCLDELVSDASLLELGEVKEVDSVSNLVFSFVVPGRDSGGNADSIFSFSESESVSLGCDVISSAVVFVPETGNAFGMMGLFAAGLLMRFRRRSL